MEKKQRRPLWQYGLLAAGALWIAGKAFKSDPAGDLIGHGQNQGEKPNFTEFQYKSFADSIESALNPFWGGVLRDSPSKVVTVFKQMQNSVDVGRLINAFGERNFGMADLPGLRSMKNLQQAVSSEMSQSYRDQINGHLRSINVNVIFV